MLKLKSASAVPPYFTGNKPVPENEGALLLSEELALRSARCLTAGGPTGRNGSAGRPVALARFVPVRIRQHSL